MINFSLATLLRITVKLIFKSDLLVGRDQSGIQMLQPELNE